MNLETPCILVDVDILNRNILKMAEIAKKNKVNLRPHTKTHKIPDIAKMQIDAGCKAITVAKVSEAEVMVAAGISDIFIAYPIIGKSKIERLLILNKENRIIVGVDSIIGAKALAEAAYNQGQRLEVRLEVDIGYKRTGVPYSMAVETAKEVHQLKGLILNGIFTFKAMTLKGEPTDDRKEAGLEEGRLTVEIANLIRKEGIEINDVSVGSTPTSEFAASVEGITEIRPGTYVFNDVMTVKSGFCSYCDCAARVMTTVVSKPSEDRIVIDGGSKTFSTDYPLGVYPSFLEGYGKIVEDDNLILERFSEEHGMIRVKKGAKDINIGDRLTIIPNHICTTINLHDKLYLVKGKEVIKEVSIDARGKVY